MYKVYRDETVITNIEKCLNMAFSKQTLTNTKHIWSRSPLTERTVSISLARPNLLIDTAGQQKQNKNVKRNFF